MYMYWKLCINSFIALSGVLLSKNLSLSNTTYIPMETQGGPDMRGSMITKELPTFELWMKCKMEGRELIIQPIPISGERVDADYFVPDNSASDKDVVISLGWKYMANLDEPKKIASMYASAMAAFAPELKGELLIIMKHQNIHPQRIFIPSQANARGIVLNDLEKYGPDEALVLFGTAIRILFKNIDRISNVAYYRFVKKSINTLGNKVGLSDGVLSRLKFPLTLEKARAVKDVFGPYKELKAKIIRYLLSACKKHGDISIVAGYMCEILSWSEMTDFVAIKEVFHATGSPVLQHPDVQHEVRAFYYAMNKVDNSEHPQFYRYFCSGLEESYLERCNFPILAQAAEQLILEEIRARKSERIVEKSEANASAP